MVTTLAEEIEIFFSSQCGRTESRDITKIGMESHLIVRYNHTKEEWFPINHQYIGDSLRIGKGSVSPDPFEYDIQIPVEVYVAIQSERTSQVTGS